MAKKRKNTKGTKNNFDNRGQQQNPKSRAPKRNNGKGTKKKLNGEVDDYQLREKVEAGGFPYWYRGGIKFDAPY